MQGACGSAQLSHLLQNILLKLPDFAPNPLGRYNLAAKRKTQMGGGATDPSSILHQNHFCNK